MKSETHIGLGGGCHWCTEAVFQSLRGVERVEQGWLAPAQAPEDYSEGVIVHFDRAAIDVETLVAVHLHTHSCTSNHALRSRYRSAVYVVSDEQAAQASAALAKLQQDFAEAIVTQVLRVGAFRINDQRYLDYYLKDPDKPFCQTFIAPKLELLLQRFANQVEGSADIRVERTAAPRG